MVDFFEFFNEIVQTFQNCFNVDLERLEGKIAHSDT